MSGLGAQRQLVQQITDTSRHGLARIYDPHAATRSRELSMSGLRKWIVGATQYDTVYAAFKQRFDHAAHGLFGLGRMFRTGLDQLDEPLPTAVYTPRRRHIAPPCGGTCRL